MSNLSANERIRQIINHYCKTQQEFANKVGKTKQWVSNLVTKDFPIGKKTTATIVAAYPNLNPNWILFGSGNMLLSDESDGNIAINLKEKQVPLISQYAYAGYLCGFADEEYLNSLPTVSWDGNIETKGEYIVIEVRGDSMDDRTYESILEGDLLYCRKLKQELWQYKLHFNVWDFVIIHKTDGIIVKRIVEHDVETGNITLHSLNPLYEDQIINIQDVLQIFNVVEIKRKRKRM